MGWLKADPRRLVALRVALEVLVALAFTAYYGIVWYRSPFGVVGVAIAAALRGAVVSRLGPRAISYSASLAALVAMVLAGHAVQFVAIILADASVANSWFVVPLVVAAYALVVRPRAGLAFVSAWWLAEREIPIADPLLHACTLATVASMFVRRSIRMPATWGAAGLALALACTSLVFEHRWVGVMNGFVVAHPFDSAAWIRMVCAGAMVVFARYLLADRTWAVLALIVACAGYATLAPPHFPIPISCMPAPHHPLDAHYQPLLTGIAIVLALTWALPFYRALRPR